MQRITHIMPVGHTKTTLLEGLRQYPFHRLIMVLGKEMTPGEEKARKLAKELEETLKTISEIEYLYVDIDDVYSAAIDITAAIRRETEKGHDVKINASGSVRTLGISCYLASALTGTKLYIAVPSYKEDVITGIRKVLEIPHYPLKKIGENEEVILKELALRPSKSVDELLNRLDKDMTSESIQRERAKISYHLKKLREDGFITTQKKGKKQELHLTRLGKLFSAAQG